MVIVTTPNLPIRKGKTPAQIEEERRKKEEREKLRGEREEELERKRKIEISEARTETRREEIGNKRALDRFLFLKNIKERKQGLPLSKIVGERIVRPGQIEEERRLLEAGQKQARLQKDFQAQTEDLTGELGLKPTLPELPPVTEQAPVEEEVVKVGTTPQGLEQFRNQVTGEEFIINAQGIKEVLFAGGVSPVTAGDLTDVVLLATPVGVAKGGVSFLSRGAKLGLLGKATKNTAITTTRRTALTLSASIRKHSLELIGKVTKHPIVTGGIAYATYKLIGGVAGSELIGVREFQDRVDGYQQSFNTIGEQSTEWLAKVNEGRLPALEGIRAIEINEKELMFFERQLQSLTIAEKDILVSGEWIDVATDLREKRIILQDAKDEMRQVQLRGQFPEVDEAILNKWLSESSSEERAEIQRAYEQMILQVEKDFPQSQAPTPQA